MLLGTQCGDRAPQLLPRPLHIQPFQEITASFSQITPLSPGDNLPHRCAVMGAETCEPPPGRARGGPERRSRRPGAGFPAAGPGRVTGSGTGAGQGRGERGRAGPAPGRGGSAAAAPAQVRERRRGHGPAPPRQLIGQGGEEGGERRWARTLIGRQRAGRGAGGPGPGGAPARPQRLRPRRGSAPAAPRPRSRLGSARPGPAPRSRRPPAPAAARLAPPQSPSLLHLLRIFACSPPPCRAAWGCRRWSSASAAWTVRSSGSGCASTRPSWRGPTSSSRSSSRTGSRSSPPSRVSAGLGAALRDPATPARPQPCPARAAPAAGLLHPGPPAPARAPPAGRARGRACSWSGPAGRARCSGMCWPWSMGTRAVPVLVHQHKYGPCPGPCRYVSSIRAHPSGRAGLRPCSIGMCVAVVPWHVCGSGPAPPGPGPRPSGVASFGGGFWGHALVPGIPCPSPGWPLCRVRSGWGCPEPPVAVPG